MQDTQSSSVGTEFTVNHHLYKEDASPDVLLDAGRLAIDDATRPNGWLSVKLDWDRILFRPQKRGNSFAYAEKPPLPPGERHSWRSAFSLRDIREWGTPVSDSELPDQFEDLEDFEGTNFDCLFSASTELSKSLEFSRSVAIPQHLVGDVSHILEGERPRKRPRLDHSLLHQALPEPHFQSSSFADTPPVDKRRIKAYRKTQQMPLAPYTLSLVEDYLGILYARGAWIIPIRGRLEWEGASPAFLVEPPENAKDMMVERSFDIYGTEPTSGHHSDPFVKWTRQSLLSFWNLLSSITKVKTLGPVAISFHAAPSDLSPPQEVSFAPAEDHNLRDGRFDEHLGSDSISVRLQPAPLHFVDHIKIYHNVQYTLYLRTVIDAFQFIEEDVAVAATGADMAEESNGTTSKPIRKIRVLKGARLVMTDDRSQGVFVL